MANQTCWQHSTNSTWIRVCSTVKSWIILPACCLLPSSIGGSSSNWTSLHLVLTNKFNWSVSESAPQTARLQTAEPLGNTSRSSSTEKDYTYPGLITLKIVSMSMSWYSLIMRQCAVNQWYIIDNFLAGMNLISHFIPCQITQMILKWQSFPFISCGE